MTSRRGVTQRHSFKSIITCFTKIVIKNLDTQADTARIGPLKRAHSGPRMHPQKTRVKVLMTSFIISYDLFQHLATL